MSYGLTVREADVLKFIERYQQQRGGVSPTLDDIRVHMGWKAKSQVHRTLQRLEERGAISRLPGRARAISVQRPFRCPHCGEAIYGQ